MSVGDVSSQERGSGARFNDGKPPMQLIPLRVLADHWAYMEDTSMTGDLADVMAHLADFQEGGDSHCLLRAIASLGEPWAACAQVFDYGRRKYAEWNWAKGMPWSIPLACAARHLMAMRAGEVDDRESGLPHAGHVLCNIVMLYTFVSTYEEGDDRPSKWLSASEPFFAILHSQPQIEQLIRLDVRQASPDRAPVTSVMAEPGEPE